MEVFIAKASDLHSRWRPMRSLTTSQATRTRRLVPARLQKILPAASNTAVGISALSQNTVADDNTAVGAVALFDNTTGTQNTATGSSALHNNSTGKQQHSQWLSSSVSPTLAVTAIPRPVGRPCLAIPVLTITRPMAFKPCIAIQPAASNTGVGYWSTRK